LFIAEPHRLSLDAPEKNRLRASHFLFFFFAFLLPLVCVACFFVNLPSTLASPSFYTLHSSVPPLSNSPSSTLSSPPFSVFEEPLTNIFRLTSFFLRAWISLE
jgi:hypothetical protein